MKFAKSEAIEVEEFSNLHRVGNTKHPKFFFERLYQMPDGSWHIYGSGNKDSKYGDGVSAGHTVYPISIVEAMRFMEIVASM